MQQTDQLKNAASWENDTMWLRYRLDYLQVVEKNAYIIAICVYRIIVRKSDIIKQTIGSTNVAF